ncbi:MAG: hypothetical protein EBX95_03430 [Acidimicrobiia bacterium]|nr:hypothetical protein [Acidimicrobiia bacterium]
MSTTPPDTTTILYSDEVERAMSEPLTTMFGDIVFEAATERVEGIDVQIILGSNFLTFLETGAQPDASVDPENLPGETDAAATTETTP